MLLADDSFENRELMRLLLSRFSLVLDEAENGREAVELFERQTYELILMDIQMPVLDGFAATSAIRSIERCRSVRPTAIVALTAHADETDIQNCKAAGFDDHLSKPFKKNALFALLARYVRGIEYG